MLSLPNNLTAPFRGEEGISKTLLSIFILLNGIVLVNSCLHHPAVGYDAGEHLAYSWTQRDADGNSRIR